MYGEGPERRKNQESETKTKKIHKMKTNANDPISARPYSHDERPSGGFEGDRVETFQPFTGLTKREYFAAMAMQGLTSNHKWAKESTQDDWDDFTDRVASGACVIADKLINELNKDS